MDTSCRQLLLLSFVQSNLMLTARCPAPSCAIPPPSLSSSLETPGEQRGEIVLRPQRWSFF